jgi:hypothetical protein
MSRLDSDDLAREAGGDRARIARLVEVGILRPDRDGTFSRADVRTAEPIGERPLQGHDGGSALPPHG